MVKIKDNFSDTYLAKKSVLNLEWNTSVHLEEVCVKNQQKKYKNEL